MTGSAVLHGNFRAAAIGMGWLSLILLAQSAMALPPQRITVEYDMSHNGRAMAHVVETLQHDGKRYSIESEVKGKGLFAVAPIAQGTTVAAFRGTVCTRATFDALPEDRRIHAIQIDDSQPWRDKHLAAIRHAYGKRPFFTEGFAFVSEQLAREPDGALADLTCGLAQVAAMRIGLETEFVRASSLGAAGARSEHLLAICRAVGADAYVSPTGSADYMEEDGVFAAAGFPVRFKPCRLAEYPQGRPEFTPYMSFVDALMNEVRDRKSDLRITVVDPLEDNPVSLW